MVMCCRCHQRPAVVFVSQTMNQDDATGYCIKCAKELNIGPVKAMMDKMGITDEQLDEMSEEMSNLFEDIGEDGESALDAFFPGGTQSLPIQQLFGVNPDKDNGTKGNTKNEKNAKGDKNHKKRKTIPLFCSDLTRRARDGELDNIIGREKETERVIQILSRRTKNNPCLIGEPGVGKTAVAEGLALRIARGDVPAKLKNKEVQLLDMTALVAGTQFRGQFEKRIKSLIDEVKEDGNIILFIDEVHSLVSAGDSEGNMSAGNIMKPALSRGEIQVIGATTFNEYRKYIEKDAALERRFQPVTINEPSIDDAVKVIMGIREYYENFHHVKVSDKIARRIVTLSERYINDRYLPDKAIDLLDEACTCASLRNKDLAEYLETKEQLDKGNAELEALENAEEKDYAKISEKRYNMLTVQQKFNSFDESKVFSEVTEEDLAYVIELWTGIPASKVQESELGKLAHIEDALSAKIIGQDDAVKAISAAIRRSRVQISPRRHPASFIFVGPTGTGKTELVKVLSKELFDSPETLIRLDMSEYMEKHSVSKIVGSPPGYVGYDEAGQLTEKVRRRPYSVLLFDEIEKAHPDVMNILLQILDEGRITDAHGRTVNFENTVIVMTSNAGSNSKETLLGFGNTAEDISREKAMRGLREFLRPEFISRVDEIVVFKPLGVDDYEKIAKLMISEYVDSLKERGITLTYTDEACRLLAEKSIGGKSGARDLRNNIRREVEDAITTEIVTRGEDELTGVSVTAEDGKIKLLTI